ncbi:MAG: PIG-L family deacetylase [Spirochaetales bacterium]|nr:PIG-L family deacetylase [Spirochaetales bacterium]
MTFNKSILVIQAHPDDTEAWCSGTLKLLHDRGYKITIATMTAGGMGGVQSTEDITIEVRKEEAARAAALLDADYVCLDQRDGFLFDSTDIRLDVVKLIRVVEAGIVLTHHPLDYHADHRATAAITDAAAMISSLPNVPIDEVPVPVTPLLYHTTPMSLTDPLGVPLSPPQFFIDITSVIEIKMEMLAFHVSQIELMKHMHKIDDFFGEMKKYNMELGQMVGVPFAECFWQHLGGGYQKNPLIQEELASYIKTVKA